MTRKPFDYGIHGPNFVRSMLPRDDPDFLNVRTGGNVTYMRRRSYRWVWAAALLVAVIWGVML